MVGFVVREGIVELGSCRLEWSGAVGGAGAEAFEAWKVHLAERTACLMKKSGYPSCLKTAQSVSSSDWRCDLLHILKALRNKPLSTPFFTAGAWCEK